MTKKETLELPSIFVAEGYDSIEDEDGNMGFGAYVPRDKQIYVAGEVPYEMFVKALFHELAHWVQDVVGNEFNEDEANDFAERVYGAIQNLPSAQPELSSYSDKLWRNAYERGKAEAQAEIIRCRDCKYYREYGYVNGKPKFLPKCIFSSIYVNADDFCSRAERRTDEKKDI